jgi:hypothetical protein
LAEPVPSRSRRAIPSDRWDRATAALLLAAAVVVAATFRDYGATWDERFQTELGRDAVLLVTTPPWWGLGFANSKDIPFAAAFPWALLALLRAADELPRPGPRRIVAAGAAIGAALAVRPGGLPLVLTMAAGVHGVRLLPALRTGSVAERLHAAGAAAGRLAATVGLGWIAMLASWPALDPRSSRPGSIPFSLPRRGSGRSWPPW